jgi:ketosteroid isomerase-like protein
MSDERAVMEANVKTVRRLYDAFAATDLETILALTDLEIEIVQTPLLPWGGEFHGQEGLGEFFGKLTGAISSRVTIHNVFASGDQVVQVGRTAGTVNGSGVEFDVDEVHVLTLRNGKIVRFAATIDTPAMLDALGK